MMQEFVTCPNCGRYISVEDVEAPCQLCGKDTCRHCIRTCQECGKEICDSCYGGQGYCTLCKNIALVGEGLGKTKNWETHSEGALGIAKTVYGTSKYFTEKERIQREQYQLKEERLRLQMGDEAYDRMKEEQWQQNKKIIKYASLILFPILVILIYPPLILILAAIVAFFLYVYYSPARGG